ncbi:M48 family metalloprotease [Pontixanthobacter aquaemixtae]|uniref:M48 family metalloprotease n=1 Tax=Pontixanthobacter aquaemixtae TaxID=1958940 RepID=A0A844ZNW3_9SPHN|nr:M48 family metalloprotease [Pontixanthobacter aquaemixtae]MXO90061.1 M48 family metalloprotease [Pontixanthobacter aquaemixtae]
MATMKTFALASTATLSLALTACMGGEIPSASAPITQQEAAQGAEFHPQLLQEFGGTYQGPQAAYVESVGKNIAVQSGLGNARSSFTVSLLNSSVNNAFAVPGGYIYSTRQLVALMNNEAELAGVLGHEVGHVAARHSQRRQSAAQQNQILGVLGAVISGAVLGDSQIGNTLSRGFLQGSQLLTLRFSRKQELQADDLGIEYLTKAGYDPRAMSTVLASLAAQNSLDAQLQGRGNASIPAWASTHPDPASRVRTALEKAGAGTGTTNRDTFLTRIDGMLYGDDPKQGVIEGNRFIHPDLRLSFTAPQGFYMVNGTRAVSINGQSGKAQMSMGPYNGNLDSYVRSVFTALGGEQQQLAPTSVQRTTTNGLPTAFGSARVNNGNSQVDIVVYAYEFSNNQAFHFATISPAGRSSTFDPMFRSMRRISQSEANAIVPRVIDVVTVRRGDTIQSLSNRMAYDTGKVERFRVLNALGTNDQLQAGQKVKLVVRGR